MKRKNPIICVDFDGVIHSYESGWNGPDVAIDPPVDGAIEWLMSYLPDPDCINDYPKGRPIVVIYSSRSKYPEGVVAMKEYLIKHGLPIKYIEHSVLQFPIEKPAAFLTLDDRAICFNGHFPTEKHIRNFKPWNKRKERKNRHKRKCTKRRQNRPESSRTTP